MKVSVNSILDFVAALEADQAHIREVWVRIDEFPMTDKNEIDLNVYLWVTCVVEREQVPYILELGKLTGVHITMGPDATEEGLREAEEDIKMIEDVCGKLDKPVRKGKVEF